MKKIYFKCTLLTDVVLNQRAATEGNRETLDFIPGSNFLGIVAGKLYYEENKPERLSNEESLKLFHSGKIKFGDAHPAEIGEDGEIRRSLRIPAAYYRPKLNDKKEFYIYHEVENYEDEEYLQFQPKQCRSGFYVFKEQQLREIAVEKSFAVKSAYDKEKRRSADEKMYGYESLAAGSVWVFDVTQEDAALESAIRDALTGTRRIGRSRTAQYGLVEIEEIKEPIEVKRREECPEAALVYADARLIFLDKYGMPTFTPDAEKDLGFVGGKIDWEKSQIRTFQYAPWNAKRKVRDTDRCGIEKGSVFYIVPQVPGGKLTYPQQTFVGKYQNEGFGKIMINPDFLQAKEKKNGKALYALSEAPCVKSEDRKEGSDSFDHPLFKYLNDRRTEIEKEHIIYEMVNDFVDNNQNIFSGELFASQWGSIRSMAMLSMDRKELEWNLFDRENGYLTDGVAKAKWEERGRLKKFEKFFEKVSARENFNDKDVRKAIINLAAEMAKISGRK